mmetsp:Transcript_41214/g.116613  ORF Transcript_41214/g.116613 Transcript_41214/m.116613 type:complete len:206 (-) Transcript_41214:464-1081(-)
MRDTSESSQSSSMRSPHRSSGRTGSGRECSCNPPTCLSIPGMPPEVVPRRCCRHCPTHPGSPRRSRQLLPALASFPSVAPIVFVFSPRWPSASPPTPFRACSLAYSRTGHARTCRSRRNHNSLCLCSPCRYLPRRSSRCIRFATCSARSTSHGWALTDRCTLSSISPTRSARRTVCSHRGLGRRPSPTYPPSSPCESPGFFLGRP